MFPFSLNQTIGSSYPADPDDVLRTKKGLNRLGFYSVPKEYGMDPWTDDELFEGLKNFQRENDLVVDGIMKPGGPTQLLLGRRLSGRKDERDLIPKTFAPRSGLGKGEKNREQDVLGLRRGLAGLGFMPGSEAASKNTLFDSPLEKAIRNLQNNHGLKEDGIIRPKGPTLEVLANRLKNLVKGDDDDDKPKPKPKPAPNLLNLAQAVKAKDDDGGEEPGDPLQDPDPDKPDPDDPDPDDPDPDKPDEDPCEEIRDEIGELENDLKENEKEQGRIEKDIEAKQGELEGKQAELEKKQAELDELKKDIVILEPEIPDSPDSPDSKLWMLPTRPITSANPYVLAFMAFLKTLEPADTNEGHARAVIQSKGRVAEQLKSEIEALKNEILTLKESLESVKENAEVLKQQIAAAKERLAACMAKKR